MVKVSVLLYLDSMSDAEIEKCTESILENSGLLSGELQVIVLDPSRETDWCGRLKKEYPDAVEIANVKGMEEGAAYNVGIEMARGEYLSFLSSASYIGAQAFRNLLAAAVGGVDRSEKAETEKNLLSLFPVYREEEKTKSNYEAFFEKTAICEAEKTPWKIQLILSAYLVRREFLGEKRFRENLHEDEVLLEMLLRLLSENRGRFFIERNQFYYYTKPQWNQIRLTGLSEKKWWYEESVRNFLLEFMREMKVRYDQAGEKIPVYIQSAVYYILCAKFKTNLSGNDKLMMNEEELKAFYDVVWELLTMIDNDVIYHNGQMRKIKLPRALRSILLKGKAEKLGYQIRTEVRKVTITWDMSGDQEVSEEQEEQEAGDSLTRHQSEKLRVVYCFEDSRGNETGEPVVVGDLADEVMNIQVINYRDGKLELDGFFQGAAYLEPGSFQVFGKIEGKNGGKIQAKQTPVYALLKCFGVSYGKKYAVHMELPVDTMVQPGAKFGVYVKFNGKTYQLKYKFTSVNSRLLTYSQKAYWRFDRDRFLLSRRGNFLCVEKSTAARLLKKELLLDAVLLIQKNRKEAVQCVAARLWYWITRPFYKNKRIWITFDKLYKGGDNGEYFFQYCQKQQDGIDCYYVINRDAPDKPRLVKEYGRYILYANSWRCRWMVLRAEAIMATHAGTATFMGFPGPLLKYFKNLYQSDNICIQHGLSIQKIANFQNRLYANTKLYCLASPYELENVAKPIYGYEPEMLKLTGLARYDGLKNREKKQILITPTWRKNVVQTKGVGMTNDHNNYFKETDYFKIYNSLINDERLIAGAKRLGYRIMFLLHPAMSAQVDDYDRNDYVELVQATGDMSYEQVLTESSLMVTDYSGVQFDFAYQRKPLVYYHPDALPPHYTEGGLIYATMGFGPICTSHEQLIDCLCEYMEQGCRMKPEYKERADRFFAFDDFDNAKRIYEEVLRFESGKQQR